MSLGIVIKGAEGVVLAAESRSTFEFHFPAGGSCVATYENARKVLSFGGCHNYVGAVTYGLATIGLRTANSYLSELETELPKSRLTIEEFAKRMSAFFKTQWDAEMPKPYSGVSMVFYVAGFNEGKPYGEVYNFQIPSDPTPKRADSDTKGQEFQIRWGGQREFVDRITTGCDPVLVATLRSPDFKLTSDQAQKLNTCLKRIQMQIPLTAMALQDYVDLATFFIRTTIAAQGVSIGPRGCGGVIDVATITRNEGLQFIQKKAVKVT